MCGSGIDHEEPAICLHEAFPLGAHGVGADKLQEQLQSQYDYVYMTMLGAKSGSRFM